MAQKPDYSARADYFEARADRKRRRDDRRALDLDMITTRGAVARKRLFTGEIVRAQQR